MTSCKTRPCHNVVGYWYCCWFSAEISVVGYRYKRGLESFVSESTVHRLTVSGPSKGNISNGSFQTLNSKPSARPPSEPFTTRAGNGIQFPFVSSSWSNCRMLVVSSLALSTIVFISSEVNAVRATELKRVVMADFSQSAANRGPSLLLLAVHEPGNVSSTVSFRFFAITCDTEGVRV